MSDGFHDIDMKKKIPLRLAHPPVKNIFCAKRSCSSDENCLSTKSIVSIMPASELPIILGWKSSSGARIDSTPK